MSRQRTVIIFLAAIVLCSNALTLDRSVQARQPLLQSLRNRWQTGFWHTDVDAGTGAVRAPTARKITSGERLADEIFAEARGRNRSPEQIADAQSTSIDDVWAAFMQTGAEQDRAQGAGNDYHSLPDGPRIPAPINAPRNTVTFSQPNIVNAIPPVDNGNVPALQPFLAPERETADTQQCCDLTQCLFRKKEKNADNDLEAQLDNCAAEYALASNSVETKF